MNDVTNNFKSSVSMAIVLFFFCTNSIVVFSVQSNNDEVVGNIPRPPSRTCKRFSAQYRCRLAKSCIQTSKLENMLSITEYYWKFTYIRDLQQLIALFTALRWPVRIQNIIKSFEGRWDRGDATGSMPNLPGHLAKALFACRSCHFLGLSHVATAPAWLTSAYTKYGTLNLDLHLRTSSCTLNLQLTSSSSLDSISSRSPQTIDYLIPSSTQSQTGGGALPHRLQV